MVTVTLNFNSRKKNLALKWPKWTQSTKNYDFRSFSEDFDITILWIYIISFVPAQIPYLGIFWFLT